MVFSRYMGRGLRADYHKKILINIFLITVLNLKEANSKYCQNSEISFSDSVEENEDGRV